jgi:hypothetical protein
MNMHVSRTVRATPGRHSERGGTRLKFLVVVAILAAIAYAGYQFIPVAYKAYQFKDSMQLTVDKAAAMGQGADWVEKELKAAAPQYDVPPNAEVKAAMRDGRMEARVHFIQPVPLVFYTYQYDFDNTVKSSQLFSPKSNP